MIRPEDRRPGSRRGPPDGWQHSPEGRASISAAMRERWKNPEYRSFIASLHAGAQPYRNEEYRAKISAALTKLPPRGTPERRLFDKLARVLGAKAARKELGL